MPTSRALPGWRPLTAFTSNEFGSALEVLIVAAEDRHSNTRAKRVADQRTLVLQQPPAALPANPDERPAGGVYESRSLMPFIVIMAARYGRVAGEPQVYVAERVAALGRLASATDLASAAGLATGSGLPSALSKAALVSSRPQDSKSHSCRATAIERLHVTSLERVEIAFALFGDFALRFLVAGQLLALLSRSRRLEDNHKQCHAERFHVNLRFIIGFDCHNSFGASAYSSAQGVSRYHQSHVFPMATNAGVWRTSMLENIGASYILFGRSISL